jgi:hypothetical protein
VSLIDSSLYIGRSPQPGSGSQIGPGCDRSGTLFPCIQLTHKHLCDSRNGLQQLQELSVLTKLGPHATVPIVVYGFGQRVPLLMVADTSSSPKK